MRLTLIAAVAAASLTALPAAAQETGQYSGDLRRMINEVSLGNCPSAIMAEALLRACREQLPQMSAGLSSLGAIQSVTFTKAEETAQGRMESYVVIFADGTSTSWVIGNKRDGKYDTAYVGD
jgi:hypothetical protein